MRRVLRSLLPLLALIALNGCIAGNLPSVRTESIQVRGIGLQGLTLGIRLSATNDRHSETIQVDALRVNVRVGNSDLGQVDLAEQWDLPPNQTVLMETDVTVPVHNLPDLVLAGMQGPVPYHLEGTAHVANIGWSVSFSYDGFVPQEQLINAAMPALPFGLSP